MKNLLKLTSFVTLLTILFVNVITSKNDKSNHFSLENLVALNTANAEDGDELNCNCPLLWGDMCHPDNYGYTCAIGDECPAAGSGYCN